MKGEEDRGEDDDHSDGDVGGNCGLSSSIIHARRIKQQKRLHNSMRTN